MVKKKSFVNYYLENVVKDILLNIGICLGICIIFFFILDKYREY